MYVILLSKFPLQWARIVLVVERGVSPEERLKKLMDYSQPMSDGRRALVLRLSQSVKIHPITAFRLFYHLIEWHVGF